MQRQHEVDQGAGKRGAGADQDGETRASDLHAAFEIDDPQRRPEIPVRLRREAELAWRAAAVNLDVVSGGLADGNRRVRYVRNRQQQVMPALLDALELGGPLLDLLRARAVGLLEGGRVEALFLRACHFLGRLVLLALQAFDLRQQVPALRFERSQFFEFRAEINAAVLQSGTENIKVVANERRIEHSARILL